MILLLNSHRERLETDLLNTVDNEKSMPKTTGLENVTLSARTFGVLMISMAPPDLASPTSKLLYKSLKSSRWHCTDFQFVCVYFCTSNVQHSATYRAHITAIYRLYAADNTRSSCFLFIL